MKTLYHRLADQIGSFAQEDLPSFVSAVADRVNSAVKPIAEAPQTHLSRMAQSARGHQNPGPGKAQKMYGKK